MRLPTCKNINVAGYLSTKVPSSIFSDMTMYPGVTAESRKVEINMSWMWVLWSNREGNNILQLI